MVVIESRCDAIESETINSKFIGPVREVRKKESQNFVLTIVVDLAVPEGVVSFIASVEILVVSSVPQVETVLDIRRCVAVNDINNDSNS